MIPKNAKNKKYCNLGVASKMECRQMTTIWRWKNVEFIFFMSRAENRHHTIKWKNKRKHRLADKCCKSNCVICHCNKVLNIPDRQLMRQPIPDKNKLLQERDEYNNEEWENAHEILCLSMYESEWPTLIQNNPRTLLLYFFIVNFKLHPPVWFFIDGGFSCVVKIDLDGK